VGATINYTILQVGLHTTRSTSDLLFAAPILTNIHADHSWLCDAQVLSQAHWAEHFLAKATLSTHVGLQI
jgi:hypothetical protein